MPALQGLIYPSGQFLTMGGAVRQKLRQDPTMSGKVEQDMRITGNKPITGVQGSKGGKKRVSSGSQEFAPDLGGDVSHSAQTAGGPSIQGMDALLALQEVDEREARRTKAARHGHTLLDSLESIRADLLAGVVSEDRLEALARQVENRQSSGDERVDSVLEEIELRVKVELAKLGRFVDP